MKALLIAALLTAWIPAALAQINISIDDIEKTYKGDFNVSMDAKLKYFPDNDSFLASDSMNAFTVMHENDYYFQVESYEIVKEGVYNISVNNETKTISYSNEASQNNIGINSLSDLFDQKYSRISSFETNDSETSGITITFQNRSVLSADLIVERSTNFIKKCTVKYIDGWDELKKSPRYVRMEIEYSNYKIEYSSFPSAEYGFLKFFTTKNNSVVLNNSYATYDLLTQ